MMVESTRGGAPISFLDAVERGLAADGGLFMPVEWPVLDAPPGDLGPELADTAAWAAPILLEGVLPTDQLAAIARDALDFTAPVVPLGDQLDVLELFRGPTLAFKDVGARFLARLWVASSAAKSGEKGGSAAADTPRDADPGQDAAPDPGRLVLVATSGDTGGAVAQACLGLPGIRVVVLFPAGRVSPVQRHQFTTLGHNVVAVAVDGPFDRCQALAKEMLGDPLQVEHLGLTSANSINIGRLIPQVFYYLHLARLRGWGRGQVVERPVIVPSGNLGNVTAGILAKRAGAPLGRMVAACNTNDALVRYLADGETREVPVEPTLSTAMDVGAPSNLERLLHMLGEDPAELAKGISALSVSTDETTAAMEWAFEAHGMVLDPHTAVGVAASRRDTLVGTHPTVLATAHPAKFPGVVESVVQRPPPAVPRLQEALNREEEYIPLTGGSGHLAEVMEKAFRAREGR